MCGLMSNLVICKFQESMVIHDTECPHQDQVYLWIQGLTIFQFLWNLLFKIFLRLILGIFNVQIQYEGGTNSCKLCIILKLKTCLIFISRVVVHCWCHYWLIDIQKGSITLICLHFFNKGHFYVSTSIRCCTQKCRHDISTCCVLTFQCSEGDNWFFVGKKPSRKIFLKEKFYRFLSVNVKRLFQYPVSQNHL